MIDIDMTHPRETSVIVEKILLIKKELIEKLDEVKNSK